MRIAEAFCKMRLSDYCSAQDIDRAIAVTVDSFISSQKVSCKKALSRAFAKYVFLFWFVVTYLCSLPVLISFFSRYTLARPTTQRGRGGAGGASSSGLGSNNRAGRRGR